jgi:SH3-like domain-containing protein
MTRRVPFAALLFILLSGFNPAQATEFKSVGAMPAVAYNAPSDKARKVFVAPRGMPVEVILVQDVWTKVRDSAGDLFWLQSKSLISKHNVIVTAAGLKLHATADEASATIATIDKGVLLELVTPASSGWVKLKHRDGPTGFARIGEVWGE